MERVFRRPCLVDRDRWWFTMFEGEVRPPPPDPAALSLASPACGAGPFGFLLPVVHPPAPEPPFGFQATPPPTAGPQGAIDGGGPFRDTLSAVAEELMSDALPLFVPSPIQGVAQVTGDLKAPPGFYGENSHVCFFAEVSRRLFSQNTENFSGRIF